MITFKTVQNRDIFEQCCEILKQPEKATKKPLSLNSQNIHRTLSWVYLEYGHNESLCQRYFEKKHPGADYDFFRPRVESVIVDGILAYIRAGGRYV